MRLPDERIFMNSGLLRKNTPDSLFHTLATNSACVNTVTANRETGLQILLSNTHISALTGEDIEPCLSPALPGPNCSSPFENGCARNESA